MIDNIFSTHALGKLWGMSINKDVNVRQCLLGSFLLGKRMNTPEQPFIHNFKQGQVPAPVRPEVTLMIEQTVSHRNYRRFAQSKPESRSGGARRSRTDDILLAKQALYQLSYGPIFFRRTLKPWLAWTDSNCRPYAYQAYALTT